MSRAKQMKLLATKPALYARFVATGRLPQGVTPRSPLLDAVRAIAPQDRVLLRGFVITQALGYSGRHEFATVAHALHWLAPSDMVFGSFPAEAFRIKSFTEALSVADVLGACTHTPPDVQQRYSSSRD
jgi:hypothetical protein